jgi:hexokinase
VAIDGSVFEKFTGFQHNMTECLGQLIPGNQISLQLVKDGSGIGAALAAFVSPGGKSKTVK